MMTFAVFGAGFLMRPIGAIVLGAYIDKVGRRKGLIVTLSIMATGTFLIVLILLSDHWPVGAAAGADRPSAAGLFRRRRAGRGVGLSGRDRHPGPQRLLHQLAVGQSAGCHHGGSRDGLCPQRGTGAERYQRLGLAYSVPFGCLIVPFIFILRRKLEETQEFTARRHHLAMRQVFATLLANWQVVIAGMMMVAMTTTAFYLITVYAPTFGKKVLMLSASDSLLVTLLVAISNFFWLPVGGALSDRFGRRSVLIAMTLLALATARLR